MLRGLSKLRNLGQGYVNFGEPMPLMTYLNQHVPDWRESIDPIEAVRPAWLTPTVNNIAADLMVRINNAGAANAMNLTKKQPNTPEGEAIASVAVAVSSLMTVAILTLAAVCASFISPVFELPAVKTASGYLLPALFGSMALGLFASSASGSKVVKGGIKGVLPVLIIMTVLSLAARLAGYGSVLGGLVGIFIIVMLPIGILTSYVLWKKGRIQVVDKEQK